MSAKFMFDWFSIKVVFYYFSSIVPIKIVHIIWSYLINYKRAQHGFNTCENNRPLSKALY
jgi:hypothetical protein